MNKPNDRVKVGTVIDEDGVIMGEIYEGDKIVTKNQDDYKHKHIINFQKKEAFVKLFTSPIETLFKELPTKEFAVAIAISPFVSYKDGILRYKGKIADIATLSDVLAENYKTFAKIMASLEKKQIIAKVKRQSDTYQNKTKVCIVVNPYLYLKGQDIEKDIDALFKDSKWARI